jgi:hypothetical protein
MKTLLLALFTLLAFQIDAQDIEGDWSGKISYQGMELPLVLHVTENNGDFKTTMDSPAQEAMGIPVDKTSFENEKFSIEINEIGMGYMAVIDEKGETLTGTFSQQGLSLPLVMTKKKEKKAK